MADEAAAAPATRVLLRREDRVYVIVGLIIVAGIAVVTTAALMAPGRQGDIWLEIAKSTMYLVALAVAGGVVTTVVRDRDAAREERLRWREHRLAFLDRLDDSYTQIKAARRLLRTLGFVAASSQPLDGEQVHGFRTQMATLNEAQLTFEMAARQVRPASFGLRSGEIEHRAGRHRTLPAPRAPRLGGGPGRHRHRRRFVGPWSVAPPDGVHGI